MTYEYKEHKFSNVSTNERMRLQGIGKRKYKKGRFCSWLSEYTFYDIKTDAVLFTGNIRDINEHLLIMEKG